MEEEETFNNDDEEKRVELERKKIRKLGLESASESAFGNITSEDQKEHHKKMEEKQKTKKFIGFG